MDLPWTDLVDLLTEHLVAAGMSPAAARDRAEEVVATERAFQQFSKSALSPARAAQLARAAFRGDGAVANGAAQGWRRYRRPVRLLTIEIHSC